MNIQRLIEMLQNLPGDMPIPELSLTMANTVWDTPLLVQNGVGMLRTDNVITRSVISCEGNRISLQLTAEVPAPVDPEPEEALAEEEPATE